MYHILYTTCTKIMSVTISLFVVVFPAACLRNRLRLPKAFAFSRMSFNFLLLLLRNTIFFRIFDWSLEEWRESLIFFLFSFFFFP